MEKISPERRSANMRAIRSKDTRPELEVRRALRTLGLTGYRLHRRDLPGKPDIAFLGRRTAILVHGCFWHGHGCARGGTGSKSNEAYWTPKIAGNRARDERAERELSEKGWRHITIWECETRDTEQLKKRLKGLLET